ncbi:hypothetical protein KF201_0970 [Lactococcus lactis subsp. lactis]|nr:hypothetical protein KF201_0970 [Lactococcus lactis subsp. lactis]
MPDKNSISSQKMRFRHKNDEIMQKKIVSKNEKVYNRNIRFNIDLRLLNKWNQLKAHT